MPDINTVAAAIFAVAVVHTFSTTFFVQLAQRHPRYAGLLHLLGEVELVFAFWAIVLLAAMAVTVSGSEAIQYAATRQYTEPLFVVVTMVVAASRPLMELIQKLLTRLMPLVPARAVVAQVWLNLALVPLIGSLVTEPVAMTLAALMLRSVVFRPGIPEWLKYGALGVLFVNISIGGTLTSFAAPPVLMVANTWNWDSAFMARNFGWKAAIAVVINATAVTALLRHHLSGAAPAPSKPGGIQVPLWVSLVHLAFLAAVVALAHQVVMFMGLFLVFLVFSKIYSRYQTPLILKQAMLVGLFLAGLVVLCGLQGWWLQPIVSSLAPTALFFSALGLTAIVDNAALTYLGSLIEGMSDAAKYMLVAGAVAGGGLTVIANAPNPAGVSLLKRGFNNGSISAGGLLLGAALPTAVAAAAMLWL